jgi:LysM repeat protein
VIQTILRRKSDLLIIICIALLAGSLHADSIGYYEHKLKKGESYRSLAKKYYGIGNLWRMIRNKNPELEVGKVVRIPKIGARKSEAQPKQRSTKQSAYIYQMQEQDTLMDISCKFYGTVKRWRRIQRANPDLRLDDIAIGQTIKVPAPYNYVATRNCNTQKHSSERSLASRTTKPANPAAPTRKKPPVAKKRKDFKPVELAKPSKKPAQKPLPQKVVRLPLKKVTADDQTNGADFATLLSITSHQLEQQGKRLERKIASLNNTLDETRKQHSKHEIELKTEITHLQSRNENLQLKLTKLETTNDTYLKDLNEKAAKIRDLETRLENLKVNFKEESVVKNKGFIDFMQNRSLVANSEAQALKEKHRLLSLRYWIAQNGEPGTCKIDVADAPDFTRKKLLDLILDFNAVLGRDKVYIDPSNNGVTLVIPSDYVTTGTKPRLKKAKYSLMAKLQELFQVIPISSLQVTAFVSRNARSSAYARRRYGLVRALAIVDHFVQVHGLTPQLFTATSFGSDRPAMNKKLKNSFLLSVRFKHEDNSRGLAALRTDEALEGIEKETLSRLLNPVHSSVEKTETGLNIDLYRHTLFTRDLDISHRGKSRLHRLIDMVSLVDEKSLHITWHPGIFEDNEDENRTRSFIALQNIYSYLTKTLHIPKAQIKLGYSLRQQYKKIATTIAEDKINKRISIKLVTTPGAGALAYPFDVSQISKYPSLFKGLSN